MSDGARKALIFLGLAGAGFAGYVWWSEKKASNNFLTAQLPPPGAPPPAPPMTPAAVMPIPPTFGPTAAARAGRLHF